MMRLGFPVGLVIPGQIEFDGSHRETRAVHQSIQELLGGGSVSDPGRLSGSISMPHTYGCARIRPTVEIETFTVPNPSEVPVLSCSPPACGPDQAGARFALYTLGGLPPGGARRGVEARAPGAASRRGSRRGPHRGPGMAASCPVV